MLLVCAVRPVEISCKTRSRLVTREVCWPVEWLHTGSSIRTSEAASQAVLSTQRTRLSASRRPAGFGDPALRCDVQLKIIPRMVFYHLLAVSAQFPVFSENAQCSVETEMSLVKRRCCIRCYDPFVKGFPIFGLPTRFCN